MKQDLTHLKTRIKDYIEKKGIIINTKNNPPTFQCPEHSDKNPSCVIYAPGKDGTYNAWCPVCQKSFDVFELAGIYSGITKFPDKIKEVESVLGMQGTNTYVTHEKKTINKQPVKTVPFTEIKAKELFKSDYLLKLGIKSKWGNKINGIWLYKNQDGLIELVDIRYEGGEKKKNIISFFYTGEYIKSTGAPVVLYGRENLSVDSCKNKPILISEGAKCANIAKALKRFISMTWNGGSSKAYKADWSILKDREVYFLIDDDHEYYESGIDKGKEKLPEEQPGLKAAIQIKKQLPKLNIVLPPEAARKIKESGADIEEFLQVMKPDELTKYILNPKNHYQEKIKVPKKIEPVELPADIDTLPFKVLGIADDGKAYFIDQHGRLFDSRLESITQNKMLNLAPYLFWKDIFGYEFKMSRESWTQAQDWIISISGKKDFDLNDIRGRGAWREDNGEIVYHDGQKTHGKPDPRKLYLRKQKKDIGILDEPIKKHIIEKVKSAIMALSFETPADAIRCIAWSTLAEFGGALPWRPAFLLTGASKSGKTTVADFVIRKIAAPVWLRGDETTPAGIRGGLKKDSACVVFDESDDDTEKKRQSREALFSMMRASTSDDAPDIWKGTADQGKNSYSSKNMFGFISISTQVESEADLNRLCFINVINKHSRSEWLKIKKNLINIMTDENCRAIRSRTWRKLKTILAFAEEVATSIQDITGMDNRYSILEGILLSAYFVVWRGMETIDDNVLEVLKGYFKAAPPEKSENATDNIIHRLLDESIQSPIGKYNKKIELREIVNSINSGLIDDASDGNIGGKKPLSHSDIMEYKKTAGRYGLAVVSGNLAIRHNHHEIMKIIQKGKGYHKQLRRHTGYVETKNVSISGTAHACVILTGILDSVPF